MNPRPAYIYVPIGHLSDVLPWNLNLQEPDGVQRRRSFGSDASRRCLASTFDVATDEVVRGGELASIHLDPADYMPTIGVFKTRLADERAYRRR